MTISTLMNAADRKRRSSKKTKIGLGFFKDETYSIASIIQMLFKFKSTQAAYQTLAKMERDGLIKRAQINMIYGRSLTVWGITEMGLHYADDIDAPLQKRKIFEPSKIKPIMMQHKFDLQIARIKGEQHGWTNWVPGELLGRRIENAKYPDAVAKNQAGETIAIELERTIKSRKRYAEILVSHLMQRKNNHWEKIYYLSPNEDLAARIKRAFHSIEQARHNRKRFKVTPEHLEPFYFYSFNDNNWL